MIYQGKFIKGRYIGISEIICTLINIEKMKFLNYLKIHTWSMIKRTIHCLLLTLEIYSDSVRTGSICFVALIIFLDFWKKLSEKSYQEPICNHFSTDKIIDINLNLPKLMNDLKGLLAKMTGHKK